MTDNEIIKALEQHYIEVDKGYSTHLEYGGKGDEHEERYIYMIRDALDLINRQKAENDNLKNDELPRCKDALRRANEIGMGLQAEVERLKEEIELLHSDYTYKLVKNKAKAEAIKEFAERLKQKTEQIQITYHLEYDVVFASEIDNLLKEMVGDNEEEVCHIKRYRLQESES